MFYRKVSVRISKILPLKDFQSRISIYLSKVGERSLAIILKAATSIWQEVAQKIFVEKFGKILLIGNNDTRKSILATYKFDA
jgi:hypothetical protein